MDTRNHVLVVEDDADIAGLVVHEASQLGYDVTTADTVDGAKRRTAQWLKATYAECTRDDPIGPPLSPSTAQPRHRRQTPDELARPSTAALSAHDGRLHRTAAAKGAQRPLP